MQLPNYVSADGEVVFSQPFVANGVNFYGFVLNADESKLQAYCDKTFNEPSGGEVSVRPVGPYIMLVFCDLAELAATSEPYSNYGKFTEGECAMWLLLLDEKRQRMFFAFPYIWVDNEYAMAMGRELYGFPKGMAEFQIPASKDEATLFKMNTLVVDKFGPDAVGHKADLITIRQTSPERDGQNWTGTKELMAAMWQFMESEGSILQDVRLMFNEMQDAIHLRIPMIFLKQFRDTQDGSKACFQAINEVPCGMTHFDSGGLLTGDYELDILDVDSAPMRASLGLDPGPITPVYSFWCRFNFEIGNGEEIWKA